MTEDDVERIAMRLPGVVREPIAYQGFSRLAFTRRRIFAVMPYRDASQLHLRTSPQDQATLLARAPLVFARLDVPRGAVAAALDKIDESTLAEAIAMAWRNNGPVQKDTRRPSESD